MPRNLGDQDESKGEMSSAPPKDLIDFHIRWPEFRPVAKSVLNKPELSLEQKQIIGWLIALSDRVRQEDFE